MLRQLKTAARTVKLVDEKEHLSPGWSDHVPVQLDLQLPEGPVRNDSETNFVAPDWVNGDQGRNRCWMNQVA